MSQVFNYRHLETFGSYLWTHCAQENADPMKSKDSSAEERRKESNPGSSDFFNLTQILKYQQKSTSM